MSLVSPRTFFDALRTGIFKPTLSSVEVDGCNDILKALEGAPMSHTAYALATAYRETASTMQPIKEFGGPLYFTRMYDIKGARPALARANGNTTPGDGPRYCGRGYVQLTWKNNYKRAGTKLGVDLVSNPALALDPLIAAKIMRYGMDEGWFTGKRFADYLPSTGRASLEQYTSARRIINGLDHALEIAEHAKQFEDALYAGDWQ